MARTEDIYDEYLEYINEKGTLPLTDFESFASCVAARINREIEDGDFINPHDIIQLIQKLCKMHRTKHFGYFTAEDIDGEVWRICITQITKFNVKKLKGTSITNALERFLNTTVKNRLNNFHRDHYRGSNEDTFKKRMNLMNTLNIEDVRVEGERNMELPYQDPTEQLQSEELMTFIKNNLTPDALDIFSDCLDQENVNSYYKSRLREELDPLLQEWKEKNER